MLKNDEKMVEEYLKILLKDDHFKKIIETLYHIYLRYGMPDPIEMHSEITTCEVSGIQYDSNGKLVGLI